ncbi:MAG TPA: glycosyltransferase family 9 protein [Acetobacteraceae bacterium]|nr:glycosyltransferase family 9 protein [Acetobacteraceae bacterium]
MRHQRPEGLCCAIEASSVSLPILSPLAGRFVRPLDANTILVHGKDQPIGDAFLQAEFFHALRCRFPKAKITFATSIGGTPYADSMRAVMAPYIDEVLTEQALCLSRSQVWRPASRPMNGRRFDLILDMEKVWWRCLAIRRVRHRVYISASNHFLLSGRWPRSWRKPAHLSRQYNMLLDATGMPVRASLPAPSFRDAEADQRAAELLPGGRTYIGLVPGAGDRDKCWPLDRFMALARSCLAEGHAPVLLLGPKEADWLDVVRRECPEALLPAWHGNEMRPEFRSPLQTVALGGRLTAAVTNDCGMAHLLAAAATPLVALFGATNPVKYAPLTPRVTILSARDYGSDAPEAIPYDAVQAALAAMVASAPLPHQRRGRCADGYSAASARVG